MSSGLLRARVQGTQNIQRVCFSKIDSKHPIFCNADLRVGEIRQFCMLQDEGAGLTGEASDSDAGRDIVLCMSQLNLSARAYHRILKLARTIVDLVGSEGIQRKLLLKNRSNNICNADMRVSESGNPGLFAILNTFDFIEMI